MSNTLAIKDHDGLCWNCLETKDNVRKIEIPELGYGSGFDGAGTEIHLCEECYQKSNPKIWGLKVLTDIDDKGNWMGEEYEFEKEIFDFIYQMPVIGQQFVLKSKKAFDRIRFIGAEVAEREEWYAKQQSRDQKARRQYFDVERFKRQRGDLYIM